MVDIYSSNLNETDNPNNFVRESIKLNLLNLIKTTDRWISIALSQSHSQTSSRRYETGQKSKLKMEYRGRDTNFYIYVGLKHQIFAVLVSILADAVAAVALISPVSDVSEFKSP